MMQTLDDLRNLMKERGLEKLIPYAERLSTPSIRLLLTEVESEFYPRYPHDQTMIGYSKIGGLPDLPPDFNWPELDGVALPFLAQLRLEDLQTYDEQEVLPSSGMLSIFYDHQNHLISNDCSSSCKVFYFSEDSANWQRRLFPENIRRIELTGGYNEIIGYEMPFEGPLTVQFRQELNVADDDCVEFWQLAEELNLSEQDRGELWWQLSIDWSESNAKDAFREVLNRDFDSFGQPFHQLLGLPYCGNYDGRDEIVGDNNEMDSHDWRLLFQLSSDANLSWGDCGVISFFILKESLESRDFSDVRVTYDD